MQRHHRPLWGTTLRAAAHTAARSLSHIALSGAALAASAQPLDPPSGGTPPASLAEAFAQAWATHPAAHSQPSRRAALAAANRAAESWTAQPSALELRAQSDRPGTNRGAQELEVGVALPLWLPAERSRSQALVKQEEQLLAAQLDSARLQLAGQVRDAWWGWQRARAELALATNQVDHAQALRDDVQRRVRAGELARADAHQAEGALAQAQATQARADGQSAQAWQALLSLLGRSQPTPPTESTAQGPHPMGAEPVPGEVPPDLAQHPLVRETGEQAGAARQAAELADSRSRANPELLLGMVHSRDQRGEPRQRQLTVGLRLPWGESPAQQALAARAHAEATELSVLAQRQHQQAQASLDGAQARWHAAQRVHQSAQQRAKLAQESQAFFDKSFRLGETDLPTRLRIAQEAQEAIRQAALATIELAAATSAWRQAAGLLPE